MEDWNECGHPHRRTSQWTTCKMYARRCECPVTLEPVVADINIAEDCEFSRHSHGQVNLSQVAEVRHMYAELYPLLTIRPSALASWTNYRRSTIWDMHHLNKAVPVASYTQLGMLTIPNDARCGR